MRHHPPHSQAPVEGGGDSVWGPGVNPVKRGGEGRRREQGRGHLEPAGGPGVAQNKPGAVRAPLPKASPARTPWQCPGSSDPTISPPGSATRACSQVGTDALHTSPEVSKSPQGARVLGCFSLIKVKLT